MPFFTFIPRAAGLRGAWIITGVPTSTRSEKLRHVRVFHADATVARRSTDLVLVIRPVDVNVTVIGVGVGGLESVEPKNPRHHEIVGGQVRGSRLKRHPRPEGGADWLGGANLLRNPESARGRLEAPLSGAEAELRG